MAARLQGEEFVIALWRDLPYHGFGICANPECGEARFCCGRNTDSRVCLICFEFEFDCKAPNYRRRR